MPTPKKPSKRAPARASARSASKRAQPAAKTVRGGAAKKATSKTTRATAARAKAPAPRSAVRRTSTAPARSTSAAKKASAARTTKTTRPTQRTTQTSRPARMARTAARDAIRNEEESIVTTHEVDEPMDAGALRPVAVGSPASPSDASTDAPDAPAVFTPFESDNGASDDGAPPSKPVIDRPLDELIVGLTAAVLAVSTFLPWYRHPTFAGVASYSGWASGTWGPVVFFLALAAVGIVAARRLGVRLAFPVEYSFVLEGVGWVSVVAVLLKRWFPASVGGFGGSGGIELATANGLWVALGAALLTAVFAGRVSRDMPIVLLPGWFRDRPGKLGAAILVVAIGAGAAFGLMNGPEASAGNVGGRLDQPTPEIGLPTCGKERKFPTPQGIKPVQGSATGTTCVATFTTKLSLKAAYDRYKGALQAAKWKVRAAERPGGHARTLQLLAPECGQAVFSRLPKAEETTIYMISSPDICDLGRSLIPSPGKD